MMKPTLFLFGSMIAGSSVVTSVLTSVLTSVVTSVVTSVAFGSELRGVIENNRGVQKLQSQKPVEAFDKFTSALGDLPFSGAVHFNLGTAFLANKEIEKSVSEFQEAIQDSPGNSENEREIRFRAYFNSGVALTEAKRVDEALQAYQHALDEKPDSVETKTNIELLTKSGQGKGDGDKQDDKQDKDNKDQGDKGQNKDQKDQKDPKEPKDQKDKPKDQKPQQNQEKPKPTPRPFKSQELNQQDVGKILDELKSQEEQIRARMQNEKTKDAPPDKDW